MNRAISYWSRATDAAPPLRARRLARGPTAWLATAGACAYVAASGVSGAANPALLLLAATSTVVALGEPRITRPRPALLAAMALFGLSALLSTATSIDPTHSLQLGIPLVPGALLFLVVAGHCEPRHVRALYATFSLVALVMAVQLLAVAWQDPWAGPIEWTDMADMSWLVVRNDVGFFAVVLPLALALALEPGSLAMAILGAVAVVADASVVVVYQCRGAVVATLVVLAAWAVVGRRRMAVAIAAGTLLVMLGLDAAAGFTLTARVAETWVTRVAVWLAAFEMFLDAPWLGHGLRAFGLLFADYFNGLRLPAWLPADPRFSPWAHSLWLETLAEQGIIGFGVLVTLVALAARAAVRVVRAGRAEVRRLGLGAGIALLAVCVEAVFELSFIRLWAVVVFFALVGAITALDAEASADGNPHA